MVPLRQLKMTYGMQPVIVPEVEVELRSHKRLGIRCEPQLNKALHSGTIQILDKSSFAGLVPISGVGTSFAEIQELGNTYALHVGSGEAYSHAAAVQLGTPILSHDNQAVRILLNQNFQPASPVLRAFDILALSYQIGSITGIQADQFRKCLLAEREMLPAVFHNCGFEEGLPNFGCRIVDEEMLPIGFAQRDHNGAQLQMRVRRITPTH